MTEEKLQPAAGADETTALYRAMPFEEWMALVGRHREEGEDDHWEDWRDDEKELQDFRELHSHGEWPEVASYTHFWHVWKERFTAASGGAWPEEDEESLVEAYADGTPPEDEARERAGGC